MLNDTQPHAPRFELFVRQSVNVRVLLTLLSLASVYAAESLTAEQARGKELFRACSGCHNVLTDARKSGPSLRTLFGKVRLVNGKRTLQTNVEQLILDGYNGMPSYRHMFRPDDWSDLIAYLKTLRARPEIGAVLKPVRGSDLEVLATGKRLYEEHCLSCHETLTGTADEPVKETVILPRARDNHGGTTPPDKSLDDAAVFSLLAYLKAQ